VDCNSNIPGNLIADERVYFKKENITWLFSCNRKNYYFLVFGSFFLTCTSTINFSYLRNSFAHKAKLDESIDYSGNV